MREVHALSVLQGCPHFVRYYGCWFEKTELRDTKMASYYLFIQTELCLKFNLDIFVRKKLISSQVKMTENRSMNPPESSTGKAWWSKLRIIHACLYLTAAILAFNESKFVWIPLTIDVIFGLISFLVYHYY